MLLEYLSKALTTWWVGFFPAFEIYVAIPTGLALGLTLLEAVLWGAAGNFTPILLIHFGYERLKKIPRLARWMERLSSERVQARVKRYGAWFVLFFTPLTGVWVMALTAKALHMDGRRLLWVSLASILAYGSITALLVQFGVEFATA
jgi:uncharacterized membrane protein